MCRLLGSIPKANSSPFGYDGMGGGIRIVPCRCLCMPFEDRRVLRVCCFQVIQFDPSVASQGIEWGFPFVEELSESSGPITC